MIQIFAKQNTDEKIVIFCHSGQTQRMLESLNKSHGEGWVWVDALSAFELLKFNDGLIYEGFHGRDERYAQEIKPNPLYNFLPARKRP